MLRDPGLSSGVKTRAGSAVQISDEHNLARREQSNTGGRQSQRQYQLLRKRHC